MGAFGWERRLVTRMLARVDVAADGARCHDIRIRDEAVYRRILYQGSLGLGESYVEGLWDCEALDEFFHRVARPARAGKHILNIALQLHRLRARLCNLQSAARAVSLRHYDAGNPLFERMLDRRMVYSCAYWTDAQDLDGAQEAKLDLVCRKLGLRPGMRVLDIGCGWGSFMRFAAERYGVSCVGVTISPAQYELGQSLCRGLPVEFHLRDYRAIEGRFDAVASIGMFEHVGRRNYRNFFEIVRRSMQPEALFLLHTIGARSSSPADAADPWLSRHVFPNGELPGTAQIATASDGLFVLEDWHNFGPDYERTLLAWHARLERAWPELGQRIDGREQRAWRYYLLSCAGLFRARAAHLWQIVFSRRGVAGGYRSVR